MGNLFASLLGVANTMNVFDRQLANIQNNISNASTPGYVKQTQSLVAKRVDYARGLTGGVEAGPLVSSRSQFAEQGVQQQLSQLGLVEQKASDLTRLEPLFDIQTNSGVAGAITSFFNSFSQLSINPNDHLARQTVIDSAGELTSAFNETANGLAGVASQARRQVNDIVGSVNRLGEQIRQVNAAYRQNFQSIGDAGLDAQMFAGLEELAEYVGFTTIREPDGTVSVYLGGQVPLVVGDQSYPVTTSAEDRQIQVIDSTGRDIADKISTGKLAGVLEETNQLIPAYTDSLNSLAGNIADTVNHMLSQGVDANGAAPTVPLFEYDQASGAAISMTVTGITAEQIAAASADAPGGNSNALDIAALVNGKSIDGYTYMGFFGNIAGGIGREINSAQNDNQSQQSLVQQARSFRSELSSVSINDEAVQLVQVQRAYQAGGKLINVLNELMDTLINIIR